MIFSRGRKSGRHSAGEPRHAARDEAATDALDELDEQDPDLDDADDPDEEEVGADFGPYDISEAPAGERVDFGSLKIPPVQGVEIRFQTNQADDTVQQVTLVSAGSALQLGAFAAPRTEAIWDEVRTEIRASLKKDGVNARETRGVYGTELRARVSTPDGPTDVRFVGIDGPRWMVRAVYQGPAAVDAAAARPLDECLRGLVVDRGRDAMPEREPLPMRMPREIAEQARAQAAAAAAEAAEAAAQGRVNGTTGGSTTGTQGRPGTPRRRSR